MFDRIDAVDLHLRPVPVLGHGRFTAGKGRDFRIVIRRQRILLAVLTVRSNSLIHSSNFALPTSFSVPSFIPLTNAFGSS